MTVRSLPPLPPLPPLSPLSPLSPCTGWSRTQWAELADTMLAAVRPYASEGHARITLPGAEGGNGRAIDGLEGFARTFLLAGFRLAGERGDDPGNVAEWYAQGLATGTDPASPDRWVRLDEHPQAKVEAASIALVLDLTRPWIWDRLDPRVRERVIEYLSPAVGDSTYPRMNWVWFRLVVQTFLRSVDGPWSATDMAEDLATHDGFVRADGWLADGVERSYDHYVGWALHLYPTLWARMAGAQDLAAPRRASDTALLDRYLVDAVALVGADGSPLIQGRSLGYRFAAAAPFWVGAMAEVPSVAPGLLRRAASGILGHFAAHGAFDERGLLTPGWHGPWPRIAQAYSGPGSPYWASKGMLGLALPADHAVWTAVEEPLPVEREDTLLAVRAPGWLVSGTRADGIVRVVNHGTDHAVEGATSGDSPLYARLGYSTATSPLLDEASWVDPLDQSVVLVDADGRATHRTGLRTLTVEVLDTDAGPVGVAASIAAAHWLTPAQEQEHHGSGYVGVAAPAGRITVVSLVRGPWELRLARVDDVHRVGSTGHEQAVAALRLRIAGWAASGPDAESHPVPVGAGAAAGRVASSIRAVVGEPEVGTTACVDASPLGRGSVVPWLLFPVHEGVWVAALLELTGARSAVGAGTCTAVIERDGPAADVTVTWPDGARTRTRAQLTNPSSGCADPATR
ncbi:DUF2264 domain-containing protein [Cellulomonas sp. KRMCY2]|uniref:DUF2264 domain-containing protein n=1 Tax=Cellulomonas sp. KRMCY2 TaxID=1304865 RepID=UPI0004B24BDA|nr:DUF2264 domain-containing protein [Cellulomonas sp. KRMCY2]